MLTFWRTDSRAAAHERSRDDPDAANARLYRDIALVALADGIVGLSFGAAAVAAGLPWWVPVALSVLVFAGGSQIAAVGVVLGGGSPVAAVAAGAVLNTRLLPYGLAVADVVSPATGDGTRGGAWHTVRGWLTRMVGAHLITDESVAFALRQAGRARRRFAFWACGGVLFAVWNGCVLLGVLAGSMITNTGAFGLDATFPAVMAALALPALTSRPVRKAAGAGAVIAVALTPVLPAGLPLLAALGGLAARRDGWHIGRRAARPGHAKNHDSDTGGIGQSAIDRPGDEVPAGRAGGS